MNKQAILHYPYDQYGFQTEERNFKVVIRTAKNDVKQIKFYWGDPYNWSADEPQKTYHSSNGSGQHWNEQEVVIMQKSDSTHLFDFYSFVMKNKEARYLYFFQITDFNGETLYYTQYGLKKREDIKIMHSNGFNYNYASIGKTNQTPKWFNKTNWYQIFPDSFNIENNKKLVLGKKQDSISGGTLKGIIEKLDYIHQLGFSGIYLCPIFDSPSNHKYDTRNYYEIDKTFGTMEDFQLLIKEIHLRNMKIMLDVVFNHCGSEWANWLDVIKNKENSPFANWFKINDFNNLKKTTKYKELDFKNNKPYETFGNTPLMPRLNWQNKELRKELLNIIKFWTNFNIDAWRLDVADEVGYDFWRDFRKTVRDINENVVIVGEIWYNSTPWLRGDIFDSTMNYIFRDAILDHFEHKNSIDDFRENLINIKYTYNDEIGNNLLNLVGSHDVKRFATLVNNKESYQIAYALMILQKGTYSMYYGDELGLKDDKVKGQRGLIDWKGHIKPNEFLKKIIQFKKANNDSFTKNICYPKNNVLEISLDKFSIYVNTTEKKIKLDQMITGLELLEQKEILFNSMEPFTLKIIQK